MQPLVPKNNDQSHPFSPPDSVIERLQKEHQALTSGLGGHQWEDQSRGNAAESKLAGRIRNVMKNYRPRHGSPA